MAQINEDLDIEMDRLHEQYGKPLEGDHWGELLAVSRDGRVLLAPTHIELLQKASEIFSPPVFAYKIGEISVGRV